MLLSNLVAQISFQLNVSYFWRAVQKEVEELPGSWSEKWVLDWRGTAEKLKGNTHLLLGVPVVQKERLTLICLTPGGCLAKGAAQPLWKQMDWACKDNSWQVISARALWFADPWSTQLCVCGRPCGWSARGVPSFPVEEHGPAFRMMILQA